jgi:hypothetical protein
MEHNSVEVSMAYTGWREERMKSRKTVTLGP